MTDLRTAAQQALEALENHTAIKHPQQRHYRDSAIDALRAALAEQIPPSVYSNTHQPNQDIIRMAREAGLYHFYDSEGHCTGITDARLVTEDKERNDDRLVEMLAPFAALVAAAERERIIAANAPEIERVNTYIKSLEEAAAVEPLTNETIMAMWPESVLALTALEFARAIERAHGIGGDA